MVIVEVVDSLFVALDVWCSYPCVLDALLLVPFAALSGPCCVLVAFFCYGVFYGGC